ncbi:hypothetical protein FN846DRAFT_914232 [Sphaerosporella brunnea]|uniref:Uncharacterized protein n=1 Tax=Sphaerosporella brunnea TaxID=1250544 RepID=A0A5J5ED54_9PEZI|nr:hypothetical protein FN846DRAFT_914232 [Sphaerosporella brunnea]
MAASTNAEVESAIPGLAEVRRFSQPEVMALLEREGVLEGFSPEILDRLQRAGITGRHLVQDCHDPAFLRPDVGRCLSNDIAKFVKELYETAAHPLPNASIERLRLEPQRRHAQERRANVYQWGLAALQAGAAGFGLLGIGLIPPDLATQCGGWNTCVNRLAWG